jgi:GNAT superfamily N-acetyltransferase
VPEVPQVVVRDAVATDARAIGAIWAAAVPFRVRSAAGTPTYLATDSRVGRRRWVAELDGEVVGTSTARREDDGEVFVGVEVHPDFGSRGVGSALLLTAMNALAEVAAGAELVAVSNDDAISMAFGVRHGFLPDGEHRISRVDPATVALAGEPPDGLSAVRLDRLEDLGALLATHNAAVVDDPSGMSHAFTPEEFRARWWGGPDNAPGLSWALVDDQVVPPVVASFSSVEVDRARRRAWSSVTATHPSYRGRGLASWVKRRTLNSLSEAGVREAWTGNDATNAPMLAVNDALGYRPAARTIRVRRRLPG